jgi:hypothetical protein
MKHRFLLACMLLMLFPALSFAQKKVSWPEMKAFHGLMSVSFHSAEEGKFEPLKMRGDSLFVAAEKWYNSPVPAGFKADKTKETLKTLVEKTRVLQKHIEGGSPNEKLMAVITEAHDVFHKIVGECREEDH